MTKARIYHGERQYFQYGAGKTGQLCKGIKLEYSLITYIKKKVKLDQRPKYKPLYYKTLIVKYKLNHKLQQYLYLDISP